MMPLQLDKWFYSQPTQSALKTGPSVHGMTVRKGRQDCIVTIITISTIRLSSRIYLPFWPSLIRRAGNKTQPREGLELGRTPRAPYQGGQKSSSASPWKVHKIGNICKRLEDQTKDEHLSKQPQCCLWKALVLQLASLPPLRASRSTNKIKMQDNTTWWWQRLDTFSVSRWIHKDNMFPITSDWTQRGLLNWY